MDLLPSWWDTKVQVGWKKPQALTDSFEDEN